MSLFRFLRVDAMTRASGWIWEEGARSRCFAEAPLDWATVQQQTISNETAALRERRSGTTAGSSNLMTRRESRFSSCRPPPPQLCRLQHKERIVFNYRKKNIWLHLYISPQSCRIKAQSIKTLHLFTSDVPLLAIKEKPHHFRGYCLLWAMSWNISSLVYMPYVRALRLVFWRPNRVY